MNTDQQQIVQELIRVLGLPQGLRSFTVRASVTGSVLVECEYYPQGEQAPQANPVPMTKPDGSAPPPPTPPPTRFVCDSWPPSRKP